MTEVRGGQSTVTAERNGTRLQENDATNTLYTVISSEEKRRNER